jgi:hypothetical protein
MARTASAHLLVGRKIVGLDLRSWVDSRGLRHDPKITLDNGAILYFIVSETDDGSIYGITPIYHRIPRKP